MFFSKGQTYLTGFQTVELDSSFGNNGIVITSGTVQIDKTLYTADDKLLCMGYYYKNNQIGNSDWVLARYNYDGSLDNGFGVNGLLFNDDTCSGMVYAMAIQSDHKILVVGKEDCGYVPFIARYNANGAPDLAFGDHGIVMIDFISYLSSCSSLALLENNQILLGGLLYTDSTTSTVLLKLNSDGSVDNSFGNAGLIVFDEGHEFFLSDCMVLEDGNILCYGAEFFGYGPISDETYRVAILKLNTNGELVTSFGNNGKLLIDVLTNAINCRTKAIEMENNQIILGGDYFLIKLHPNGSLDDDFGNQGIIKYSCPFTDIAVWKNEQIFVAGSKMINDYDYGYSVCRFNANGTIDETFNSMGYFDFNISTANDYLQSIIIQPDGKLLLSGSSRTTGAANFTLVRLITDYPDVGVVEPNNDWYLQLYPNPTTGELTINNEQLTINNVEVFDVYGRRQKAEGIKQKAEGGVVIDISHLVAGVYFVKVYTEHGVFVEKVIKN